MMTNNVVLLCDDNYFIPTAVCAQSIIDDCSLDGELLTINICAFSLSEKHIRFLKDMGNDNVIINTIIVDESSYKDKISLINQKTHVTPTALIKFELPNILCSLDSVLYLDSDIIISKNIKDLLNINIDGGYLAASYELWEHIERISYSLNYSVSKYFYFNSGVMLLNLKKMRAENITEKLWEYKLYHSKTARMDQESFNAICAQTAIQLPIKWNFNPVFCNKIYLKEINKVYHTSYSNLQELEDDVCVVHYVGTDDKPWNYETARMRRYWDIVYNKLFPDRELNFKTKDIKKHNILKSIINNVKENGVLGFCCHIIYRLRIKLDI